MFKDEQSDGRSALEGKLQEKMAELAELAMKEHFGEEGPPEELTFREIEEVGFRIARMAAASFATDATKQQQRHFEGDHPCPQCGAECEPRDESTRRLLTRIGPVDLSEVEFHCNACRRSFFPSTEGAGS